MIGQHSGLNTSHLSSAKSAEEECKPNYEAAIAQLQKQRAVVANLLNAFYEYFTINGYPSHDGPVAMYIGQLEMESRQLLRGIEELMARAERTS